MSDSDITAKIEHLLNRILSKKYNADIKIKFVDSEEVKDAKGRNNNRVSGNDSNARKRN